MSRKRHDIYPIELPTYRKPTPLILFNRNVNIGVQTDNKQVLNKTCHTGDLKTFIDSACQTEITRTSTKIKCLDSSCQISVDMIDNQVQTDTDHKDWSRSIEFPSILKPLQRYQLTTSLFVQPTGFSPMATLLTPMGNVPFLFCFYRPKICERKRLGLRTIMNRWLCN